MAVTLSADLTVIDDCEALTGWSSNETIVLDPDSKRQGTNSIAIQKVSLETSWAQYDYYTDHGSTYLDITGETHIYFWTQCKQLLDTKANGGIRIRLTDASGNYREWWVGGYDNYYGGFQNYVIYTGTTPNASSGTLNLAQIQYITFYWKVISKNLSATNDCFVDIIYYGTGLIVKGGTSADKGTFDQIITADETPAYGVLSKKFGAFIVQGPITFGDNVGTTSTYFKDESKILLFADAMVSSTHYELKVVGNSTGTNSFELGSSVGGAGISGCIIKSVGTSKFKFTATDTNVNILKVCGSLFLDSSTVSLPPYSADKSVLNTTFEKCAEVLADTCTMTNCNFISSAGRAVRISSTSHNVTSCNFINCQTAVHHDVGGSESSHLEYDYNKLMFTGGTYHIENSASTPNYYIDIDRINGSNPDPAKINNSNGGSTTLLEIGVPLEINGVKTGTEPSNYVRCRIEKQSDGSTIMNQEAQTSYGTEGFYKTTMTYSYTTEVPVRVRARYKGYLPFEANATITSTGLTVTAVWLTDPNYTS